MRFPVDAQLPPALARVLAEHGHDAEHVHAIGMASAPDQDLWRYALQREAVLVTKDQDFVNPGPLAEPTPVIVWIRLGNTSRRSLLAWFEPLIEQLVSTIAAGERLVELR